MTTTGRKKTLNSALKLAVFESGRTQGDVSQGAGIGEVRFSQIVNRHRKPPTDDEQDAIAAELGLDKALLFGDPQAEPPIDPAADSPDRRAGEERRDEERRTGERRVS